MRQMAGHRELHSNGRKKEKEGMPFDEEDGKKGERDARIVATLRQGMERRRE